MRVSIIIPTLNEAEVLGTLLQKLRSLEAPELLEEIIVVDGGSSDDTLRIAREYNAIGIESPLSGRAVQMNLAAGRAKGDVLYFLHADTIPPRTCLLDLQSAIKQGVEIGCFRLRFDRNGLPFRINGFFTRFNFMWCRGGDQSLFVRKAFFDKLEGYNPGFRIMEEYDLINRAKRFTEFRILPKEVLVSARKYESRSFLRVNVANLVVYTMYARGYSQEKLVRAYQRLLG